MLGRDDLAHVDEVAVALTGQPSCVKAVQLRLVFTDGSEDVRWLEMDDEPLYETWRAQLRRTQRALEVRNAILAA